jgi:1,4-alpha-glucan branching enzyme
VKGFLSLVLHAHLPFVRHPEHEQFLEENWFFEGITETYVPLLQMLETWERDGVGARLAITLTPTLCAMMNDDVLRDRYSRHVAGLIALTEKEVHRTQWQKGCQDTAEFYLQRLRGIRDYYQECGRDLVGRFRRFQERGVIEIIASAATHAILPLLASHRPSVRGQVLVGRDYYEECFGRAPRGLWLPECAWSQDLDPILKEGGIEWFITDTHGILRANPAPRHAVFAPILTERGIAAFGRDFDSAKQVWSRTEGYPGDPRYRDFYRDIGFDLELDYLRPYLPSDGQRTFTGIKYHRITGGNGPKEIYDRHSAIAAADEHATHFWRVRIAQIEKLATAMDRPPIVVCPYDAELFGHWWYEGFEFLDLFVRKTFFDQQVFELVTPGDYLERQRGHQFATPAASSWGEGGYSGVWLNEENQWIYRHLAVAQERMTELARRFPDEPDPIEERALKQAARELLLAQASDWPFIIRSGTSPDYARRRIEEHLLRFKNLYEGLMTSRVDEGWLGEIESKDLLFPEMRWSYWKP